jgi:putative glutamine amidotransferase
MSDSRRAPLIGITCEAISNREDFSDYALECDHRYAAAVKDAGGHPVLLPIAHRRGVLDRYLEGIDGLVFVGGDDVDPRLYGEKPRRRTRVIFHMRTAFETWLYREGRKRRLPMLGICYGMQLINVLEGGSLIQHLRSGRDGPRVDHGGRRRPTHAVRLLPGTRLARTLGTRRALVATEHHQAIRDLAPGFVPAAIARDGVIEAIEHPDAPEMLAVQWHPERRAQSRASRALFQAFVRQCRRFRKRYRR